MSLLTLGDANGKVATRIFFVRADYTPVGPGVAAAVHSDITADGKTDDDIAAVVTDNVAFVRYLQTELFNEVPLFGQADNPASLPVIVATSVRSAEGLARWTEAFESETVRLEISWLNVGTPTRLSAPPRTLGPPFAISGLMLSAEEVRVVVNGVPVRGGVPKALQEGGILFPPAFLFLSTLWSREKR